jgi:ComF family protein
MAFFDLIYPKKCFGCGSQGQYFCENCLQEIELLPAESFLFNQRTDLNGLVSLFEYQGLTRLGIHKLKYRFLSDSFSEWQRLIRLALGQKLTAEAGWQFKRFLLTKPLVVPVPLYWRRQKWRGFNQSELLAQAVANNLKLDLEANLIKRTKAVVAQVSLERRQRQKNVGKAFRVVSKPVKSILIVDDVWTSGATMLSVAKTLRRSGAKTIWGLTLAR